MFQLNDQGHGIQSPRYPQATSQQSQSGELASSLTRPTKATLPLVPANLNTASPSAASASPLQKPRSSPRQKLKYLRGPAGGANE